MPFFAVSPPDDKPGIAQKPFSPPQRPAPGTVQERCTERRFPGAVNVSSCLHANREPTSALLMKDINDGLDDRGDHFENLAPTVSEMASPFFRPYASSASVTSSAAVLVFARSASIGFFQLSLSFSGGAHPRRLRLSMVSSLTIGKLNLLTASALKPFASFTSRT